MDSASQPLNVRLKAAKKIAQSNGRILHGVYKLLKKRARKTSVVQATLWSRRSTLSRAQSLLSRAMYHV